MCFHLYDSVKFPLTYNGNIESRPLLLSRRYFDKSFSHCRYVDKSFTEMFLELSSTKHEFVQTAEFDWLPWQPKG